MFESLSVKFPFLKPVNWISLAETAIIDILKFLLIRAEKCRGSNIFELIIGFGERRPLNAVHFTDIGLRLL